ncbi:MAG: hypothetical protein JXX29_21010 [Deltaproteobacteria bacterium]|nr:hypothetical protein [Deltaproteobacteria bacterium]MBN2674175.1 hypothetical protein [Deltaproteobacteria bacterium]
MKHICVSVFLTLVALLVILFSVPSRADEPVDDAEAAKASFNEGTRLFAAEKYAEAAEQFRMAYQVKPSWKIMYNIAQAESAAKRYGLALQAFELFLADGGDEIGMERRDEVLAEVRRLRDMVASLDVQGPAGGEVWVDGVKRGTLPLEGFIKVTAGKRHSVLVMLDGNEVLNQNVRLSGGDAVSISAEMSEESPAGDHVTTVPADTAQREAPTENSPHTGEQTNSSSDANNSQDEQLDSGSAASSQMSSENGKKLRVSGVVMLALGGAVAVLGGVMGGMAMGKMNDVKALCDSETHECATVDATEAYDNAYGYGTAANILIPAGLAVATTGVILYLVGKKKKERPEAARVSPTFERHGGGVVLGGRF